jgi:hypothetical protein
MARWSAATRRWLSRGKIWDDVFTRTVSILISSVIIGIFLAAVGAITISRQAWWLIGGLAAASSVSAVSGVAAAKYGVGRGRFYLVLAVAMLLAIVIAFLVWP